MAQAEKPKTGSPDRIMSEWTDEVTLSSSHMTNSPKRDADHPQPQRMKHYTEPMLSTQDSMIFAHGESGVLGGIFNYTNVIVGAGVVSLPYALYNCGLWLGIILLVVTGYFTAISSKWIIKTGLKRHQHNYEELCKSVLGPVGSYCHCIYTFIGTFTGSIAYLLIAGQSLADVMVGIGATGMYADRRFYIAVGSVCIVLPLVSLRDLHLLRPASVVSILIECSVSIIIAGYSHAYSLKDDTIVPFRDAKSERLQYFIGPNVFSGLSSFFFAYVGQQASFEVYASLKKPCYSKWKTVSNVAVLIAGTFSTMLPVSAWLNLGDSVEGNVLDTFAPTDMPVNVCKVSLAILLFMTYPMDFFVARQNMNRGFFVNYLGMPDYMPLWRFSLITFIVWGVSVTIALLFSDVTVVIGFSGAIGASFVGYITPSLMYLKVFAPEIKAAFQKSKLHGLYWAIMPTACLLFGILALVAGTVATILSI